MIACRGSGTRPSAADPVQDDRRQTGAEKHNAVGSDVGLGDALNVPVDIVMRAGSGGLNTERVS